jgi:hypothetical protein
MKEGAVGRMGGRGTAGGWVTVGVSLTLALFAACGGRAADERAPYGCSSSEQCPEGAVCFDSLCWERCLPDGTCRDPDHECRPFGGCELGYPELDAGQVDAALPPEPDGELVRDGLPPRIMAYAVDGDDFAFADYADGSEPRRFSLVYALRLGEVDAPRPLTTSGTAHVDSLAIARGYVHWVEEFNGFRRAPLTSDAPDETIHAGLSLQPWTTLARSGDRMAFVADGKARVCDVAEELVDPREYGDAVQHLAIGEEGVLWVSAGPEGTRLHRALFGSALVTSIPAQASPLDIRGLGLDRSHGVVLASEVKTEDFVQTWQSSATRYDMNLPPTGSPTLLYQAPGSEARAYWGTVLHESGQLYFAETPDRGRGAVLKLSIATGALTRIGTYDGTCNLQVDASSVYCLEPSGASSSAHRLVRWPKPT